MKDENIIKLFFDRDENAIKATEEKYGDLCYYIAGNILASHEDREECVSDVMLSLWNSIPPDNPIKFSAYIGRAVRNRALNISRAQNAWKRGGHVQEVGSEFLSMLSDGRDLAADYESHRAGEIINEFLDVISKTDKKIFVLRYWFDCSISEISAQTGFGAGKIKMSLSRSRGKLEKMLKKEGITV